MSLDALQSQYLIIGVRQSYRAIPLSLIREIITVDDIVPIPLSQRPIVGMMQLRGSALTLLDTFSVTIERRPLSGRPALVMEVEGLRFGLIVDDVVQAYMATTGKLISVQNSESGAMALQWSDEQSLAMIVEETKLRDQCQAVRSWLFASL